MVRIARFLAIVAIGLLAATERVSAFEVRCIEASRYQHLVRLFDGDIKKFAAYLNWPAGQLPRPQYCRAALIEGPLKDRTDIAKVMNIIGENHGWLAALYLRSGGGKVFVGVNTGVLARSFWLKTYAAAQRNGVMEYQPDFAIPPPDHLPASESMPANSPTAAGWEAYRASIAKLPPIKMTGGEMFCASACTQIHAGGIDRIGISRVHRAHNSSNKTLGQMDEGLTGTDDFLVAYYKYMDAGPDFMRMYLMTASQIVTPLPINRHSRHMADLFITKCGADGDQLTRLEKQIEASNADFKFLNTFYGPSIDLDRLHRMAGHVRMRRIAVEQCMAAINERERLTAFTGLCPKGCDRKQLDALIAKKLVDIRKTSH